jgi:hypothetical protein
VAEPFSLAIVVSSAHKFAKFSSHCGQFPSLRLRRNFHPPSQNRRYARASRFGSPPAGSAGSHHRRSNLQTLGFQMPKLGTAPVEHHSSS